MENSIIHSPYFGLLIILAALAVAALAIAHSNRKLAAQRLAQDNAVQGMVRSVSRRQQGGTKLMRGENWQVICPDCGAFNVFHRRSGIECRHCQHELALVGGWQGGNDGKETVISMSTQARSNRVLWIATSARPDGSVPIWAREVFQDIPDNELRAVNPETDLDWENLRDFMPVLCPSCKAAPLADCPDCLRTGFRVVPLAEWSQPGQQRLSWAAMRHLRDTYGMRCGGVDNAKETHAMLWGNAARGLGPLVLNGSRQRMDPAVLREAIGDVTPAEPTKPVPPASRSRRDGESPLEEQLNERGFHVGGYQPYPDPDGIGPSRPPRKP